MHEQFALKEGKSVRNSRFRLGNVLLKQNRSYQLEDLAAFRLHAIQLLFHSHVLGILGEEALSTGYYLLNFCV